MIDRKNPPISRRRALMLGASLSLGALVGCGGDETGSMPKITKTKKDIPGNDETKVGPAMKTKMTPRRR